MFLYSSSEKFEESKVFIELTLLKLLFLHKSSYSSSDKLSSTNNSLFLYLSFNSFIVFSNSFSSISSSSFKVNSLSSILYPDFNPKYSSSSLSEKESSKLFFVFSENFSLIKLSYFFIFCYIILIFTLEFFRSSS